MVFVSRTCLVTLLVTYLCIVASAATTRSKDAIGFPETEENPRLKNKENRQPVYLPSRCPINQLFYPGDQKDDWICDCRPAFIYHPATDACWGAYQRGPCPVGEYLILPPNSVLPLCVKSPCPKENYVQFKGKCELLGANQPCEDMFLLSAEVGVNATTLAIDCVKLAVESRFADPTPAINSICPLGCKRNIRGLCSPKSQTS